MATNGFALFNADGSIEHALSHAGRVLPPWFATWEQAPIDSSITGTPIYGRYATVVWDYSQYERGVWLDLIDLLASLRGADGTIRFRTRDQNRNMTICTGKIDAYQPYTYSADRARAQGLAVTFSRVLPV